MMVESELEVEPSVILTPVWDNSYFWLCSRKTPKVTEFVIGPTGKEMYLSEFFCGLLQHLYMALE